MVGPKVAVISGQMDKQICDEGERGLLLPLFGDGEQRLPPGVRIPLYGLGLAWCFMGVAIISDIFMGAIEAITSKKTRKLDAKTKRYHTVQVWNPTVANLTLMALGSSAPEILLSLIELMGNEFYSGELGPSTIVGSAAFNLLCITAVCISAIPEGEVRYIKELPVYVVTASFSVLAYVWLLVIIQFNTQNVVEIWEGIVTFLAFPGLVILAFMADKGYFSRSRTKPDMGPEIVLSAEMSKEELAELDAKIRQKYGKDLTAEQVSKIARIECPEHHSRAHYRVAATRRITGAKRVKVTDTMKELARSVTGPVGARLTTKLNRGMSGKDDSNKVTPMNEEDMEESSTKPVMIEFATSKYAVLENAGSVKTVVKRTGCEHAIATVTYKTRDGTANAESDYFAVDGTLTFSPGETEKTIQVRIIDDIAFEEEEEFYIDLSNPTINDPTAVAKLGANDSATIVIIDDDLPGVIVFPKDQVSVKEKVDDHKFDIVVNRKNGCSGKVTCKYVSENAGAIAPNDFDELDGLLVFEHNETEAKISVNIKARGRYERREDFRVILTEATGGAKFDPETDGGADSNILTVFIESEEESKEKVDRLMSALAVNWHKAQVGHANWRDQFRDALYVNGGNDDDEDGGGSPSVQDWIMHIITVPWKVFFAVVPPTDYCGGKLCFVCSLIMIGVVTAIIGDLAALFGCVMTIPNEVTAITFVALGTSLPDTFASKAAAQQDPHADASIGNVTGSNSVNVFLGLGLPWAIGAIYWSAAGATAKWSEKYEEESSIESRFKEDGKAAFVVMAGSLSFSVIVFSCCACTCILLLYIRRLVFGGELGGPNAAKWVSSAACVSLWLVYISLSIWKTVSG
mmetsp:Transcript_114707/g.319464  ORF Transcript_114707/g.319464 Transcript_114707/m.319464 type:complete len:858 (+) Transcript_114707:106-2679(+)